MHDVHGFCGSFATVHADGSAQVRLVEAWSGRRPLRDGTMKTVVHAATRFCRIRPDGSVRFVRMSGVPPIAID
jgi:hypothetical protein